MGNSTVPLSPGETKRQQVLNDNNGSFRPFTNDEDTMESFSITTPGSNFSCLTDLANLGEHGSNTIGEVSPSRAPNRSTPFSKGEMSTFIRNYLSNSIIKGNSSLSPTQPQSNISVPSFHECIAPPGKLGIVIDTTKKGPV